MMTSAKTTTYQDRPGCVTAYAVLLWIGGGLSLLGMFDSTGESGTVLMTGLFALLLIAVGIGLWYMQAWGWWLVVIFQSLGLLAALFSLIGGGILYALVSGGVSGGILYWFITNRYLFLEAYTDRIGVGSDGEPVTERALTAKKKNTTVVIVGVVLAIFLVPVCIIAVLTLLGPQIGSVFSQIVNELSAP